MAEKLVTPRELQVAELLSQGKVLKEAGYELGISGDTALFHMQKLHRKLGTKTQAHTVRRLIELGYIRIDNQMIPSDVMREALDAAVSAAFGVLARSISS